MKHRRVMSILLLAILGITVTGCAPDIPDNNPIAKNWSYAPAARTETPTDAMQKNFTPISNEQCFDLVPLVPEKEGFIWLRNDFMLPGELEGKRLACYLGRILCADETYINGILIGKEGRFPPNFYNEWIKFRYYPVPNVDLFDEKTDTILIKVYFNTEGALRDTPILGEDDILASDI